MKSCRNINNCKPGYLWMLILILISGFSWAGTTGKLAGRILDENGSPMAGVNVVLNGTALGSSSDLEGFYYVINVPPGSYDVEFSYIGYKTRLVKAVSISTDHTTSLEVNLEVSAFEGETVIVTAERPIVELNSTNAISTVGSDEISAMPVLNLSDIVELQAGVVDGHFRGGRVGEVQYQINGVSVNNNYNNSMSLQLDRSLLQEVQVISGTFDAEYGQAMSGVVNVVLKSGSDRFAWNAETFFSDYVYGSGDKRNEPDKFRPLSIQNYQLGLSGPLPLPNTYFISSIRRYADNGYIYGQREFVPSDSADFNKHIFNGSGDGKEIPLGTSDEITGLFKITNNTLGNIKLEYQTIANVINSKYYNFAFRLNPDGASRQKTLSLVHGLDLTHTLSLNTFYTLNFRQNYFEYTDMAYEDVWDSRYDSGGPPQADANYEYGAIVEGVSLGRFKQNTDSYIFKGALTSQFNRSNLVKMGLEFQYSEISFGVPGYIVARTVNQLERITEYSLDYPGIHTYYPINLVGYAQDQIEWQDLIFRAGLRWEYFDAQAYIPSNLRNPANVIPGAPESVPQATSVKTSVAPRIGVSYPISANAALFFAYGHFYQMPALGQFFANSDYEVLKNLQASGVSYGVLGNPDLRPERTVQYEFGYKQAITPNMGVNLNIFYKDIRDLLGVEFLSTYNSAEYARLTNVDFGNVLGYTFTFDQHGPGPLSLSMDYTWQNAMGNSSDPNETATRAEAGEDSRPRLIPLNWDQRHTLNLSLIYQTPGKFVASTIFRLGSGQPYTPSIRSGFGGELESNSGRKDYSFRADLRLEKTFKTPLANINLYTRVTNIFDEDFVNGFIFQDTGSPDYSLSSGQEATLADPNRYYPPRRIELGINLSSN